MLLNSNQTRTTFQEEWIQIQPTLKYNETEMKTFSCVVENEGRRKIILRSLKHNWCEMSKLETSTESCSAFQMSPHIYINTFRIILLFKNLWTGFFVWICFYSRMFLKFSTKFDLKGHIFPFHFSFRKALFEFLNKVKFEFISVYWGIFIFLLTLQSSWIELKFGKSRVEIFFLLEEF